MAKERSNDAHQLAYAKAGRAAGCPRDQLERFMAAGYVALPKLLKFHADARQADHKGGPKLFNLGGTRGSAKTHANIAQAAIDDCQRQDQLQVIFLRQTHTAASEQFLKLVERILQNVDCDWNSRRVKYPNGSRITIGGYKNESEIDKYLGQEYDEMLVSQIEQWPGSRIEKIRGSLRTSKPKWRPRLYSDLNPGGKGYQDVKALFITPWRERREKATRFYECWYKDNPFIDDGYREYLESLTGMMARMWRDNDWDIFAGRAFPELQQGTHGFAHSLPDSWPVVVAYDWGYHETPHSVIFARMDQDGRFWVFHEIYGYGGNIGEGGKDIGVEDSVEKVAKKVADYLTLAKIDPLIHLAGPDFFSEGSGSGMMMAKSYAQVFAEENIYLTEMPTPGGSRIQGKMAVHSRLEARQGYPGLMIHTAACPHIWRTMQELIYDEKGTGDIDTNGNDHLYDAIKHMCRWREWGQPAHPVNRDTKKKSRQEMLAEIVKREGRNKE